MARMPTKAKQGSAAYNLVDISSLPDDVRQELVNDANAGGGLYGVRVVEEIFNGGARASIFGVYKGGDDEQRWNEAKKDMGISSSTIDDAEVSAATDTVDPRRELALREAAAQSASALADRIRAGEQAEIAAITGDTGSGAPTGPVNSTDHSINIVDSGAASGAENEVSNVGPDGKPKTAKSKAPR